MSGNIIDRLSEVEAARMEENKRFNTEREIMEALAPERWAEMKAAFRKECANISKRSAEFTFECDEPTATILFINRIVRGLVMRIMTLRYDPPVPRIIFSIEGSRPRNGSVDFLVRGSSVFFANGTSGVILPEFVVDCLMDIMKHN
jgi:hypothetical protein